MDIGIWAVIGVGALVLVGIIVFYALRETSGEEAPEPQANEPRTVSAAQKAAWASASRKKRELAVKRARSRGYVMSDAWYDMDADLLDPEIFLALLILFDEITDHDMEMYEQHYAVWDDNPPGMDEVEPVDAGIPAEPEIDTEAETKTDIGEISAPDSEPASDFGSDSGSNDSFSSDSGSSFDSGGGDFGGGGDY